ncbi:MAG: beta-lactamase family protein [Prolixibacteraceae bacterium]|nr:beta-lactamase family protein [Prolixibacteraceae bacterium]
MMKKKHSLIVLILIICSACFGQQSDMLKKIMQDHLKLKKKKPVFSIQTYLSKGDAVFNEAVGFADGKNEKADRDNQFKIASITKTMTAVVILQMQEEGKLNIGDKISMYLNDLNFVKVNELQYYKGKSYGNTISIRQLLQHRSGIPDIFTDASFRFYLNEYLHKKQKWNSEKLMTRYYKYHLNKHAHFIPDSGYFYSDVNYFLLGLIIEKLSGQTLAQQFRSRIFEPLEMKNTYFEYYEQPQGNGKTAHSFLGRRDITKTLNTSYDWAGGGVVSTTYDLALFLKALFNCKLYRNDETLKSMTTMIPHTLKSGREGFYGLGISQYTFNGDIYYGHGGFWGSLIAFCPTKNLTFCGSINQVNPPFDSKEFIETLIINFDHPKPH